MQPLPALIAFVMLLGVAAFCLFGYLATFEPSTIPGLQIDFRVGYVILGIGCVGGMIAVAARSLRK